MYNHCTEADAKKRRPKKQSIFNFHLLLLLLLLLGFLSYWLCLYLTPVSIVLFVCRAFRFCRLRFYYSNPILDAAALSPSSGHIWSGMWRAGGDEMAWTALWCSNFLTNPIGSVPWSLQLWPASGHKNLLFEFYCFQSYLHKYIFSLVFSFRCILYKSRRRLPYGDIGRGWLAAVFVDVCCLFKVSEDVHWLGDSDIIIEMDDHWPLANQKIRNPSYLHSPVILSPINRPSTCHNSLIKRSPLLRCCSNCIPWHRSNSKTIRTYKHTTDFGSANFGARRWMCNLRCQLGCRSSRGCGSWKWCDSVTLRSDLQVERARKPIGGCHCLLGGR